MTVIQSALPHGWRCSTVGEIAPADRRLANGVDAELPYIGLEQIEAGSGKILQVSEATEQGGAFKFDVRHILYGKLRPYLNKVALPDFEGRCSTEAIPLLCVEGVDRRYVAAFLRRPETVAAAMRENTGSRMPRADMQTILSMPIPVPPLADQRRIADRLDEAMAEITSARASLVCQTDGCRRLRFALVDEVLGGRAVATNDARDQTGKGWVELTKAARLESGHTPSRKRPEWWGGNVPWIALPDIRALDGTTVVATSETTNELGLANSSARLLPEGTVVLSRTASVGFVAVMGKPMATSQDFVNWVPGPQLRPWYLAYALIAAREYLRGLASGAVHKTIYMPTLKSLHIRLPSLDDQDRMLGRIQSAHSFVEDTRNSIDAESAALDALPSSLLSAAFHGVL
jgi:type I restriction enzyme S subunit